tara:strand:+ start:253 stop:435 length:183 start_codon:yes stop_codon:yes gene_type:complete
MRRQSDVFFGERESGQDVRQTNGARKTMRGDDDDDDDARERARERADERMMKDLGPPRDG